MPRTNAETGLAPQEVGGRMAEGDKKVEIGAHLEITENAGDRANRLFDQLQADLKRRKQEAKQAGKNPKDIEGFDKRSQLYKDWLVAFNENQIDALEKKADKFQAEMDKYNIAGKDIPDKLMRDFQDVFRKIAEVSAAKRIRKELSTNIADTEAKVVALHGQEETLGKKGDPNIAKEMAHLEGTADVARAQLDIVDAIAVGANDNKEHQTMVPTDYVEELGADEVVELVEDQTGIAEHPNKPAEEEFFAQGEKVEAEPPVAREASEILRGFFSDLLARDQKAKIGFREAVFTKKINELVGDDTVFADLLLKDLNFRKAVQNFFDAPIGAFSNSALEKAAQFVFIIEEARTTYDHFKDALAKNPDLFKLEEIEGETPEAIVEPVIQAPVQSKTATDYFNKFFPESFSGPQKIEQVQKLQGDMDVVRKSWQIQQDTLSKTRFYEVFKRNSLKAEIADSDSQIKALSEALIGLGEQLTDAEIVSKLLPDSELGRLNKVLGDHLKSLQKELTKNDTKNILDRYGDLAVIAFAFLTVALNVAEASRTRNLDKITKPGIESVQAKPSVVVKETPRKISEAVVSSYRPAETARPAVGPVVSKPEATTPVLESKSVQKSQAKKMEKKEKRVVPEQRAEKKKPSTAAELDGKIGVVTGEIADLQNRLAQVPPVLDIGSLSPDQLRQMDEDPNGAKQLMKKLEAKKAELAGLEEDKLALATAELAQAAQPAGLSAGDKLDFSQIKHEFTIDDLERDEEAGMRVTGAYARDLLAAHDRVKKIQALAGATSDEKILRQYLQDAKDAQKLYEYILGNKDKDKAPNQYTLDQAQAGLSIAKKQLVALEKSLPTKDAKAARADAFEALSKIVDANKNRIAVRKGARGIDDRALHGSGGAVEILQDMMTLDLNKGAQLKKLEQAVTKINIVLKDASAESSLRADAKNLMGIVNDLKSSLLLPQAPDIFFHSTPGNVSGAMRQEIDQKVQEAVDARAGHNIAPKED